MAKHQDDDFTETFEKGFKTDSSSSGILGSGNVDPAATSLPLKKRFSAAAPVDNFEEQNRTQIAEPRARRILPGVIRHGSRPNDTLAYYYDYSFR